MTTKIIRNSIIGASLIATAVFSSQALASSCKGLDNSACSSNASCTWVGGYERKDGRQVKAFCRAKPGGKKNLATKAKVKSTSTTKVVSR